MYICSIIINTYTMENLQFILILISIIFLCLNVLRFFLSGISFFFIKSDKKKYSMKMRIWNMFESIIMTVGLIILIVNYYS